MFCAEGCVGHKVARIARREVRPQNTAATLFSVRRKGQDRTRMSGKHDRRLRRRCWVDDWLPVAYAVGHRKCTHGIVFNRDVQATAREQPYPWPIHWAAHNVMPPRTAWIHAEPLPKWCSWDGPAVRCRARRNAMPRRALLVPGATRDDIRT